MRDDLRKIARGVARRASWHHRHRHDLVQRHDSTPRTGVNPLATTILSS
jgi:hypothetical protein